MTDVNELYRKKRRDYLREWRAQNPDKVKKHAKKYRETHKKEIAAYHRKWQQENPDKAKLNTIRYLQRKYKKESSEE